LAVSKTAHRLPYLNSLEPKTVNSTSQHTLLGIINSI
jgi:hypothetical protein